MSKKIYYKLYEVDKFFESKDQAFEYFFEHNKHTYWGKDQFCDMFDDNLEEWTEEEYKEYLKEEAA